MKLIALALVLFFSGCVSMKYHCETQQWEKMGYKDAISGLQVQTAQLKSCGPHTGTKASDLYSLGREKGLAEFCTQKSGMEFGIKGGQYQKTCPAKLEADFLAGYHAGYLEFLKTRKGKK